MWVENLTIYIPRLTFFSIFCVSLLVILSAPAFAGTLKGRVEIWEVVRGKLEKLKDHKNAVVFVVGFKTPPKIGRKIKLFQKNKKFSSRVLAITQGEKVEFPNLDAIHHNVWSKSKAKPFDLGLYKHPTTKFVRFPKSGMVTVFCNIHPQMIATILVLPNSKNAVTGSDGRFKVLKIPNGKFNVYAWVEGARPVKRTIVFKAGKTVELTLKLRLKRIPIRHLNKAGKPYKKYTN